MSDYYLAPSLVAFRDEINARWPKRDKTSDGWIGDTSHAARASDHNPDWANGGVVRAIDVDIDDNDAATDLRTQVIAAAKAHPACWYVISNRVIYSRTYNWVGKPYNGSNPHDHHVHISILHTKAAETSTVRWFKPLTVIKVKAKSKVKQARAKLNDAKKLLKDAGKSRPAAAKAAKRTQKTLNQLPKE